MAAARAGNPSVLQKYFNAFRGWYLNASGYRALGLRIDDLLKEEDPDVKNAVQRLSEEEYNLRAFRIKRAMDLSLKHQILPKDQWTKPDEDVFYLTPLVEAVTKERKERESLDRV
ncbi:cytochrome b-c1 complex subunit 7 isoform X2 [Hydra vulgaris]|uniref:Cytochrome b-c1 complex subunit 7 n=1 Tax=Hydra vulgaris TaxID=6087 RepID=A0ABM4D9M8_HYDVU